MKHVGVTIRKRRVTLLIRALQMVELCAGAYQNSWSSLAMNPRLLIALCVPPLFAVGVVAPLQAQSPDALAAAVQFARNELTRQGIGPDTEVVFDVRQLVRSADARTGRPPTRPEWTRAELRAVELATGVSLGTLDGVRKCVPVPSGGEACHFRPVGGVVAASAPEARGDAVGFIVHTWFQLGEPRTNPETGEPFEVIYAQFFEVFVGLVDGRWSVTEAKPGPPGIIITP